MKRRCYLKIKSFDGGVEIGGVEKIQDENGPIAPLRLLIKNEEDAVAAFSSLKSLIDRFGERAEDFCMDWAFVVKNEMSASEFLKKIDGVDYVPVCELNLNQEKFGQGPRAYGRFGVFVSPRNEEMSEFEKRTINLLGGLKVRIESEEDEGRFADALQKVSKDNGPWASSFFRAWAEAFGPEIKGGDFGLLAEAVFIPLMTIDEAMQKNRAMLKCVFDDEEEIERELKRRMPHYIQTSEGVIWAGYKIDAEQKGGC